MPQDAFTLRCLCKELSEEFSGGKVNRIVQPSENDVVLTIYTGKRTERLVLDVNPARPRIGIDMAERESPLTAPNFCMLLRKHLLSATIKTIRLIGFDRIVAIDFLTSSEFSDSTEKTLYVELMGRYSNIILTEGGKILGGNRGINCFDVGVRPLIVGRAYVYPPTGDKKEPSDLSLKEYFANFNGEALADYICAGVQGVASSTATEIVLAYAKARGVTPQEVAKQVSQSPEQFVTFMCEFLYNPTIDACVIEQDGELKDVCVFPYRSISGNVVKYATLMQAESKYFTEKINQKRKSDKIERIKAVLKTAEKKAQKRVNAIAAKEKDALDAERDKIFGELILANIYRVKQGDDILVANNYYSEYEEIEIPLDPTRSPSENAEMYYKRYNKKKRTLASLKPQKEKAEEELKYVRSVIDEFSLAETEQDLDNVIAELKAYGLIKDNKRPIKSKKHSANYNEYVVNGYTLKVGRNNMENDQLTASANSKDLWLHSKDYHSAHLIIAYKGEPIPMEVIVVGAEITAYYSKARNGGKTEIVYAEKKHVKKPNGAKPGFCTYTNFSSVTVTANRHPEFLKSE